MAPSEAVAASLSIHGVRGIHAERAVGHGARPAEVLATRFDQLASGRTAPVCCSASSYGRALGIRDALRSPTRSRNWRHAGVTLPEVSVDDTDCRAQIDRLLQDEQISLCTRVGDTLLSRHGLSDPF